MGLKHFWHGRTPRSDGGYALLSVVAVIGSLLIAAGAVIRMSRSELSFTAGHAAYQEAFYAAETGVQWGLDQLEQDRDNAKSSTSWSYATDGSIAAARGVFEVSIEQDPLYPSDPARKLIRSTGSYAGQVSVVQAHALVQDQPPIPCPILFSDSGTSELLYEASLAGQLFDGDIFSNQDVKITVTAAAIDDASGTVSAGNDFISNSQVSALSDLTGAELYYGSSYQPTELLHDIDHDQCTLDTDQVGEWVDEAGNLLGVDCTNPIYALLCQDAVQLDLCPGLHFSNGARGHGEVSSPFPYRDYPLPDYDVVKNDPRAVIVNEDNVPFGSWDSATGTWTYTGPLVFPSELEVIYYVEGNAVLGDVHLAEESNAAVVARGSIYIEQLSLLDGPLADLVGAILATPPDNDYLPPGTADADPVDGFVAGTPNGQNLLLLAEEDVIVGDPPSGVTPALITELGLDTSLAQGITFASLGLGAGAVENHFYAYAETGQVWLKVATLAVDHDSRACLSGSQGSTATLSAGVLTSIGAIDSMPVE